MPGDQDNDRCRAETDGCSHETQKTGVFGVKDALKQFFQVPSSMNIASRQCRRRRTWSVADRNPDVCVGDLVEKFGQKFIWSSRHKTYLDMQPLRAIGDPRCDCVLDELDPQPDDDILQMLLSRADAGDGDAKGDDLIRNFIRHYSAVPKWVDWDAIRRGQEVFIRDLPTCGLTLFYLSLVGGFSAPLITKVLRATGYLTSGQKRVMRRLADTGHMICECLLEDSLHPRGEGWKAVLRVRLLHGMVRRRLRGKPYWKEDAWGVAINQEDMAATLLAFSYNVLVGTEMVLGRPLSDEEQYAYMHLWRYIGWLIGIEEEHNPCVDVAHGKAALESVVMHLLEPDEDSIAVAHHLLRSPARGDAGLAFRQQLCRRFLGAQLADALRLPNHGGVEHVVTIFLWCMRAYGWLSHSVAGPVLQGLHRWALRQALLRGKRIGSNHQMRAEPPAAFSAAALQGRRLSSDELPSPAPPLSGCPFLSLSSSLAEGAGPGVAASTGSTVGETDAGDKSASSGEDVCMILGVYVDMHAARRVAGLAVGGGIAAAGVVWALRSCE